MATWSTDIRWTKLRQLEHGETDSHMADLKKIAHTASDDSDEEWLAQLERDYATSRPRRHKTARFGFTDRALGVALTITIIITITLASLLLTRSNSTREAKAPPYRSAKHPVCETKGCISAAYSVLNKMDDQVDPCQDFYQYSCGRWLNDTTVPTGTSKWTGFHQVSEHNLMVLKKIFDKNNFKDQGTSKVFSKVKDYYSSCINKTLIEERGEEPLKTLIKEMGSWSVTEGNTWSAESWNFEQTLSSMHKLKSTPLFYMFVSADDKNSSQNIIQIQQAGITLSDRDYYFRNESDKVVKKYKEFMVKMAILLGAEKSAPKPDSGTVEGANGTSTNTTTNSTTTDPSPNTTETLMEEVYQFEKKLAEIYEPKEKLRDSENIYHKMTLEDLQQLAPAIPWMDYMNNLFSTPVGHDEPVVVYTPNFLKNMSELVIRTDRRILANYMVWHLIKPLLTELSKPFREESLELLRVEKGVEGGAPTWKSCVTKTDSVLGFATGYLYIKQHDGKDVKERAEEVIHGIKDAFIANLASVKWMDDETKTRAQDKAEAVFDMIGYPDWVLDDNKLDEYYAKLEVSPHQSFENYLNARKFYHQRTMEKRGKPVDKGEWHMTPVDVNAYYNAANNYIAFPSGILQKPFFDPEFPQPMNYGAVGMVMGHELTHGFDSKGQRFDKQGNMKSWWKNESVVAFQEHASCMVEQYENFTIAGQKVDGKQTLDENIADNGGLKLAFEAHTRWEDDHKTERRLPGLQLSRDQLFFLGFAQVWCSSSRPNSIQNALLTDAHSPEKVRVQAAVSNSDEFAEAFSCPIDSPMNPRRKCKVW